MGIAATLAVEPVPEEYGLAEDGGFLSPIEPMTWHHLERRSPQYRRRYRSYGRGRYGYGGYRRRGYYRPGYGVRKMKLALRDVKKKTMECNLDRQNMHFRSFCI